MHWPPLRKGGLFCFTLSLRRGPHFSSSFQVGGNSEGRPTAWTRQGPTAETASRRGAQKAHKTQLPLAEEDSLVSSALISTWKTETSKQFLV